MTARDFFGALSLSALLSCASEPPSGEAPPLDLSVPQEDAAVPPPPRTGDSLPTGAISFFNSKSCPSGWEPFAAAAGRSVVPAVGTEVGTTAGAPLGDAEDRPHGHTVTANLPLPQVSYAGIAGEANHGVARGGSPPLNVTFDKVSAGLPYVQLLICQKTAAPITTKGLAPSGTLMFFATPACPNGWGMTVTTTGRFLVGVPEKGTANQSFGGAPLGKTPEGEAESRTHTHEARGTITTSSHGIALLSGGAADGYARNGKHPYVATAAASTVEFPYIQLLQCQKL